MKKLLTLTLLALCFTTSALAQSNDDFRRYEFYGGFSHNRVSTEPDGLPVLFSTPDTAPADFFDRNGMNGFEATFTVNVSRYVGVKGGFLDFEETRTFNIPTFLCGPGRPCPNPCVVALTCPDRFVRDTSLREFLGGVQFKNNSTEATAKPFAHILVGVARRGSTFRPAPDDPDPDCGPACGKFSLTQTGFAADIVGGLDVRLGRRVDLRVFQVGYNPTRFDGATHHNFRFGLGVAVH